MIRSVHAWAVVEAKMNVVPCCGFQIIAAYLRLVVKRATLREVYSFVVI